MPANRMRFALTYAKSTLRLLASRASFCLRSLRFWLAYESMDNTEDISFR